MEEQFYLLWPLALAGLLMLFRKRPDRLFITMLALALASTVLMALLYHPADPSLRLLRDGHARSAASCSAAAWRSSGTRGSCRSASRR